MENQEQTFGFQVEEGKEKSRSSRRRKAKQALSTPIVEPAPEPTPIPEAEILEALAPESEVTLETETVAEPEVAAEPKVTPKPVAKPHKPWEAPLRPLRRTTKDNLPHRTRKKVR